MKLFASLYPKRLKPCLEELMSVFQSDLELDFWSRVINEYF